MLINRSKSIIEEEDRSVAKSVAELVLKRPGAYGRIG